MGHPNPQDNLEQQYRGKFCCPFLLSFYKFINLRVLNWFQDQAQSACFSSDGEAIVVGMTTGKWIVLDATTREVLGLFQDGGDAIQVGN